MKKIMFTLLSVFMLVPSVCRAAYMINPHTGKYDYYLSRTELAASSNLTPASYTVGASSTVPQAYSFVVLTSTGGAIALGNTPTISTTTTTAVAGRYLEIQCSSDTATITFQANTTLSGSGLVMESDFVCGNRDKIAFRFDGTYWVEVWRKNNTVGN